MTGEEREGEQSGEGRAGLGRSRNPWVPGSLLSTEPHLGLLDSHPRMCLVNRHLRLRMALFLPPFPAHWNQLSRPSLTGD